MNVSLLGFTTPCAPMVMTPHVTLRQSTLTVLPLRSWVWNVGPGTTSVVFHVPSALISPPFAAYSVSEPGNATNFSKPLLSLVSESGT